LKVNCSHKSWSFVKFGFVILTVWSSSSETDSWKIDRETEDWTSSGEMTSISDMRYSHYAVYSINSPSQSSLCLETFSEHPSSIIFSLEGLYCKVRIVYCIRIT
jgi:hypothetical protein